jgi:hypothetical protein
MSADKYSLFYCLTRAGWSSVAEGSTPDRWVRIYEVNVYQGSPFGPESWTWQSPKTHPDWTDKDADLLEEKFPRPERPHELSPEMLKALGM